MTSDDEMPWSAPWTERRGARDEAAFVADVSGALHVPDAAPEIRMIAEVMAILDIPAEPERGLTVARQLEQERALRGAAAVVPIGRFVVGRRLAGIAAAAAVALGLLTASAFAGVLPDSIQKVAHSVIDAPAPDHHSDAPSSPTDRSNAPANDRTAGGTSTTGTGGPASRPTDSAVPRGSSPAPSTAVNPPSSAQRSGPPSTNPTGSGASNADNGKGHKTTTPAVGQKAAAPAATPAATPAVSPSRPG